MALMIGWGGALCVAIVERNVPSYGRFAANAVQAPTTFISLLALGACLPLKPETDCTTVCASCVAPSVERRFQ